MTYLIGKHIKLVKFTDRFVSAKYIDWLNDQDINRYLHTGRMPISKSQISDRNNENNIMFAIMSNLTMEDGKMTEDDYFIEFIGTISLNGIDWINRKGEIGYMIGSRDHWGYGIATDAVALVADYAFNRLNLNKTEAGVVDGNIGSSKVLEKNGFKEYGRIPCDYALEGKYYDTIRYYKLQEWL